MKRILAAAIAATSFFPVAAEAEEAALDGILWRYEVADGGAVICAIETLPDGAASAVDAENATSSDLDTLKIPSEINGCPVVAIGEGAFAGREAIREVKMPGGVASIGTGAFRDCRALRGVRLPASTVEIGEGAFSGCRSLKSINLGENITNIAASAFSDCRALASVNLPANLASIGERAFADCSSIHSITIPGGVTNIAAGAFADCTSLATVVFLGPEPVVGDGVFARVDAKCFFRASSSEGWSVEIPGVWQGRRIVDLAIETYRRRILMFLPMIVGAIGTVAILVLAIVLRERRNEDDD